MLQLGSALVCLTQRFSVLIPLAIYALGHVRLLIRPHAFIAFIFRHVAVALLFDNHMNESDAMGCEARVATLTLDKKCWSGLGREAVNC